MTRAELVEACSEAAHDAWMEEKRQRGVTSWPNENGVEQLVPYSDLSEEIRDFDRIVVGAIIDIMQQRGMVGLYSREADE
jgi:hypothetical protein